MAVDLRGFRPPAPPEGLEVQRVVDDEGFASWAGVVARAFESPDFADGPSVSAFRGFGFGDAAPFRHFVCRSGGATVGASTLSLGAGVAGLANIAVEPGLRGRGIGSAVAAAALSEARGLGISVGALSAGELGLPLYVRLGFRTVSRHLTYVRARTDPPPVPQGGA
jgi:GNAT superfamily N-acetyltransferase